MVNSSDFLLNNSKFNSTCIRTATFVDHRSPVSRIVAQPNIVLI
jgi:hypothetical protein